MLGLNNIGIYICEERICNTTRKEKFNIDDNFIREKIGFLNLSKKSNTQSVLDLCLKAFDDLKNKTEVKDIDCLVLVSQNQDIKIPHTSALLHKELNLDQNCACFDIGLGCSGYVYALNIVLSFMKNNALNNALIFTCDPYSKIIDENDKNTALLFGDGASVSLINKDFLYQAKAFKFGTNAKLGSSISCQKDVLFMNGRGVFEFSATIIPKHIDAFLNEQNLSKDEIDKFIFHQGSKYIIDTLAKRLNISSAKAPFLASNYGNTVSSSIPILLSKELENKNNQNILLSGFGTGLSWASTILQRRINA